MASPLALVVAVGSAVVPMNRVAFQTLKPELWALVMRYHDGPAQGDMSVIGIYQTKAMAEQKFAEFTAYHANAKFTAVELHHATLDWRIL